MKFILLLIFTILSFSLTAQEKTGFVPDFRLSQTSAVSSGEDLPFRMTSNQNGVYALHNSSYLLFQAGLNNSQYIMSHFFLCGLSRLCATLSLGSRRDAEFAKQENRFIHRHYSRNTTLFNSLYLIQCRLVSNSS